MGCEDEGNDLTNLQQGSRPSLPALKPRSLTCGDFSSWRPTWWLGSLARGTSHAALVPCLVRYKGIYDQFGVNYSIIESSWYHGPGSLWGHFDREGILDFSVLPLLFFDQYFLMETECSVARWWSHTPGGQSRFLRSLYLWFSGRLVSPMSVWPRSSSHLMWYIVLH